MHFSNVFVFILAFGCIEFANTNILFANVSGNRNDNLVMATCGSDDFNDAITWITPLKREFIPELEILTTISEIKFNWLKNNWAEERSYKGRSGPVKDYSWESFKTFMSEGTKSGAAYKFVKIDAVMGVISQFDLNFSFLGESSAHIYLCDIALVKDAACIIIALGGWVGKGSILRRCESGKAPLKSTDPPCPEIVSKVDHYDIFSENNWSQISLQLYKEKLKVIVNDIEILAYAATNKDEFKKYTRLFVHSDTKSAFWKYHDYNYFEARLPPNSNTTTFIDSDWFMANSNELCLSLLVQIPKHITINLLQEGNDEKISILIVQHKEGWQYLNMSTKSKPNINYKLRIYFDSNDTVAIRNIYIHSCESPRLHYSKMQYKLSDAMHVKCSCLKKPNEQLTIANEMPANLDNIGNNDRNICLSIYNTTICSHKLICRKNGCHCAMGYYGDYCKKQCEPGLYGYYCKSKCGECKNIGDCQVSTGICLNGCKTNYVQETCDKHDHPILLNISSLPLTCINSCKIKIYDKELNYNSINIPKYYYTRLYMRTGKWEESSLFPIRTKDIYFNNLLKNSNYSFQVILCTNDSKQSCYTNDVVNFEYQTTCEDIKKDQIRLHNVDRNNNVEIFNYNKKRQCDLSQYEIKIFDKNNNTILNGKLELSETKLNNLQVYTKYVFEIYQNGNILHNTTFWTDESFPFPVRNASITSALSNKLTVEWAEPKLRRGLITHYLVKSKWLGKQNCSADVVKNTLKSTNVTDPKIELNDLNPYSIYNISIYAFTKKGRGPALNLMARTNRDSSGIPYDIEYDINQTESEIKVNLSVPCMNWNGPFYIMVNITCTSDWCISINTRSINKNVKMPNESVSIENLQPYTNYIVNIYLKQEELQPWSGLNETREVMTSASRPPPVPFFDAYTLNETSISLRWTVPYPPTGKLKYFTISGPNLITVRIDAVNTTKCKIWRNMYCTTLTKLRPGDKYFVTITAQNDNIAQASIEKSISISTRLAKPERPLNAKAMWDDSRILTVKWQHPNRTNGDLKSFKVIINRDREEKQLKEAQLQYSFNTKFQCTPDDHYANITLHTINSNFESEPLTKLFHCPVFKPTLQSTPMLTHVTNHSLKIAVPKINDGEVNSTLYIILIINQPEKEGDCKIINGTSLDSYFTIKKTQTCFILREYGATEYRNLQNTDTTLQFKQLPKFNFELETFEVGILLVNEYLGKTAHNWYLLEYGEGEGHSPLTEGKFNLWWLLLIFGLLTIFGCIGVLWYLQRSKISKSCFSPASAHLDDDKKQSNNIPLTSGEETRLLGNSVSTILVSPLERPVILAKPNTGNVHVSKFGEYVKEAITNEDLQKQHEKFERGLLKPTTCGERPENFLKNRYKNLVAYDSTRVKLKCVNGKPSTDYINANYIQSPMCQKAYIATQGPIDSTIYDFWFMVYTEGVQHIIMLANLVEDGNKKVSSYWPDYKKMNKILTIDDIEVCATGIKTFYSYEIRTFNIKLNDITKKVTQLHFTHWPDHGVPLYPESLMPFVNEILKIPHTSEHPILVHCSAGVGRTGTILLIDICLRQAHLNQHIDVFKELELVRNQRPNLVDNIEQYKLVHLVLLDYFCPLQTTFTCTEYNAFHAGLTDTILQNLLQHINETTWQESAIIPDPKYKLKIDPSKNRDPSILPALYGVLYLRPQVNDDSSTYINAVSVDGFNLPKRFIATQHPLANTVNDFWRLINEQDVTLIISLQPTYDVKFWDNGGDFTSPEGTLVEHVETAESTELNLHTLYLSLNGGEKSEVKMIEINGWNVGFKIPPNTAQLLAVWREVNSLKLVDSRIVVMCRNGATATGLYIAMHNLLDRIQVEQVVNVCKSVRIIRRSRSQFVTTMEQLKLLHRMAALLQSEFEIYSNFTPMTFSKPK